MVNLDGLYNDPIHLGQPSQAPADLQTMPRVVKLWVYVGISLPLLSLLSPHRDTTEKLINSLRRDLGQKGVAGIDC